MTKIVKSERLKNILMHFDDIIIKDKLLEKLQKMTLNESKTAKKIEELCFIGYCARRINLSLILSA